MSDFERVANSDLTASSGGSESPRALDGPAQNGLRAKYSLGSPSDRSRSASRFDILVDKCASAFFDRLDAWQEPKAATVFQTRHWLESWYSTIGVRIGKPVLITVINSESHALVAALPLVHRIADGLRVIEFADYGVSDYNCPILGAGAASNVAEARLLWADIKAALPSADLVRFMKMPAKIDGRCNPFALLPFSRPSRLNSNIVMINEGWANYLKSLERTFRKEFRRSWRVFTAHEGATFKRIEQPAESTRVLDFLERQQLSRMRERGASYILDRPEFADFYRCLTVNGIASGNVILTALICRGELVSALLGAVRGDTYVMLRIASGASEWSNCSPGRLVIVKTMEMLHMQGYQYFDFSIGDYSYKRRLGVRPYPLHDLVYAKSLLGVPSVAAEHIKHIVRRSAAARSIALHLLGRSNDRRVPATRG